LALLVFIGFFAACGSSSQVGKDAGGSDAKDAPAGDAPAGDAPAGDAPAATDAGDAAETGPSSDAGDAGAATDAADGPTCSVACPGLCVEGKCLEDVSIAQDTDLSTKPVLPGRTCVAAPQYRVNGLAGATAMLAEAPGDDCLAKGDEVMLIDLQGSLNDIGRVGNWELLRIASVDGAAVTFTSGYTRDYGILLKEVVDGGDPDGGGTSVSEAGVSDAGAGAPLPPPEKPQKVLLVRVPRFGNLKIMAGSHLTARAWNGKTGGVVALRAASLTVEGELSAATLGYRAGRWSQDNMSCLNNFTTESGESVTGLGFGTAGANFGGAGGISLLAGKSFAGNTPISSSPGHATPGELGANGNGRTLGDPGAPYGVADGTRLTMGSGPGGNLTCSPENTTAYPRLIDEPGQAGGIVALFVDTLTVGTAGAITASPPEQSRDIAFAGGYVLIRGGKLDVGTGRVTAKGSKPKPGSASTAALVNKAGDGYVVLDATGTITGTTDPAAHVVTH
jgi:hypothetical protein